MRGETLKNNRIFSKKYKIYYFDLQLLVTFEVLSINTNNLVQTGFPSLETPFCTPSSASFDFRSTSGMTLEPFSFQIVFHPREQKEVTEGQVR